MQSSRPRKIIMLMVDGFGWPPEGWASSVYARCCSPAFVRLFAHLAIPIDPVLGVPGIPQSATGQASLFCGFNAQQEIGRHIHAFPGHLLRERIRRRNIFRSLLDAGHRPVFANAYVRQSLEDLAATRYRSVTTVMTAAALGWTFRADDLRAGRGLYHDITNRTCPPEYAIPIIPPEQAAGNLIRLTSEYDFVLFEYFLTDRAGHKHDLDAIRAALEPLDRLILSLSSALNSDTLLLVTADHGNCEDLNTAIHTSNPVPLLLYGREAATLTPPADIVGIHDLILAFLAPEPSTIPDDDESPAK